MADPGLTEAGPVILRVDLGKTSCRAAAGGWRSEGAGAPGLAEPDGARAAHAAILAVAGGFGPADEGIDDEGIDEVIVGAAGALAAPEAARALGELLLASLHADRVAVTGDAVIAHAGNSRRTASVITTMLSMSSPCWRIDRKPASIATMAASTPARAP